MMPENIIENKDLKWKVHTPNLLSEIMENEGCSILLRPLQMFAGLLYQVGSRAAELNDNQLNKLMIRLTLYSVADPESDDFDRVLVKKILTDEAQGTTESYEQVAKERDSLREQLDLRTRQRDEAKEWNWFDAENIPAATLAFIEEES